MHSRGTNEITVNRELRQTAFALVIRKQLRVEPLDPSQLRKLAGPVAQPTNCAQMRTASREKVNLATALLCDDQRVTGDQPTDHLE
ncbi:hypothetical protein [Gemmatimonas sp.]|uniref:hypothetical protein n=1 Tax=Gemmatimonas sp. TaxID=1962908 RepID=UPI00286E78AD|nr:hypothetical protein [Gemmatimonas sp.]